MASILVDNISATILERLTRQAEQQKRSPSEEIVCLLEHVFQDQEAKPRLPDLVLTEEMSPPFDLPIPKDAKPIPYNRIKRPLPDAVIFQEELEE